ncbi:hypothetical protein [Natronorubrum texcoconense]|uniref:DUF8156 domain-containing protein n=1 Tax=Natronorubrum texcoconense TaxID=1095776 RepID=A0A1G8YCL7_9EURY|nr:hypothetical protein [Natronorubrum texcoconense]SDK00602.1 hypothetical protein SAMN04515672_2114 [Natronorubrum texcoconense]
MGRTNPTYRDALRGLESEWKPMRRALRREYQADFDRLFDRGRTFADAAGYANPTDPERALLLSLALAHEVELRRLRAELEEREQCNDRTAPEERDGRTTAGGDERE